MKRGAKWPGPGLEEKGKVLAFLMIAMVVKMIKPKIAKILRSKRSMFRVNILALRNARQPLNTAGPLARKGGLGRVWLQLCMLFYYNIILRICNKSNLCDGSCIFLALMQGAAGLKYS